jgi:hypothetical protein
VVFKEPIGGFHGGGQFAPILYQSEPAASMMPPQLTTAHPKSSTATGPLPAIAPKPPQLDFNSPLSFQGQGFQGQPSSASLSGFSWSPGAYSHPGVSPDGAFFSPQTGTPGLQAQFLSHESISPETPFMVKSDPEGKSIPVSVFQPPDSSPNHHQLPVAVSQGEFPMEEDEYWYSDDDASMADSDDGAHAAAQIGHLESNDLGIVIAKRMGGQVDTFGTQMRTFSSFADVNILSTYFPSSTNSPLNDTQTAHIFYYYVHATGPIMSLYERHPFDPSPMFQGQPVPKARQHIWTCESPPD